MHKRYRVAAICLALCLHAPPVRAACYPGLGDCTTEPKQETSQIEYYYVGPVFPPDPWLALRSEPSSTAGYQIMKMPEGTIFRRLDVSGQWYKVQLRDGRTGWAHSKWIKCCQYLKN
jgi:Bacterial SH3 domain